MRPILRRISINQAFTIIIIVSTIAFMGIIAQRILDKTPQNLLSHYKNTIEQSRKSSVIHAVNFIKEVEALRTSGILTKDVYSIVVKRYTEAHKNKSSYIFMIDKNNIAIYHPSLTGKNVLKLKSKRQIDIYKNMLNKSRANPDKFVSYSYNYTNPVTKKIGNKKTFIYTESITGITIASGYYTKEFLHVKQSMQTKEQIIITLIIIVTILIIVFSILIKNDIVKQMMMTVKSLTNMKNGDLETPINYSVFNKSLIEISVAIEKFRKELLNAQKQRHKIEKLEKIEKQKTKKSYARHRKL